MSQEAVFYHNVYITSTQKEDMSYQPLVAYIQTLLQKGYALQTIKEHLLRTGYTEQMINDAVTESSLSRSLPPSSSFSPSHTPSRLKLLMLILLGMAILIGALLFFLPEKTTPQELILILDTASEADAGSSLDVLISMNGFAPAAQGMVALHYILQDQDLISSRQESVSISEVKSHHFAFAIPSSLSTKKLDGSTQEIR